MNPYFYTLQQAKKQLVTNESSTTSIQQRNAKYFMPEEELKYNSQAIQIFSSPPRQKP